MSEKDKNTERLKELLRQKLEADNPAAEGWNEPSGKVWAGLSEELGTEKATGAKRIQRYLLMAAVAALLATLMFRECSHRQQLLSMRDALETTKDSLAQLREECLQHSVLSQQSPSPAQEAGHETSAALQPGKPTLPLLPRAGQHHSNKTGYPDNHIVKGIHSIPELPLSLGSPAEDSPILPIEAPALPVLPAGRPDPSPGPVLWPPLLPLVHNGSSPWVKTPGAPQRGPGGIQWFAISKAGAVLVGSHLEGSPSAIIVEEKPLAAFRAGIGLEAVLTRRWSVETGLDYLVSSTRTGYRLEFPFTHQNEFQHDDGNFDNTYNHSLPSPLGNYPAQLVLTRESAANVQEGELMNLDLAIRQQIQLLSLPLRAKYSLGRLPFLLSVKAGLLTNFALDISSDYSSLVSHHSAIHERHTSIGEPSISDLQRVTFDWSLGLEAAYQVTPRWGFFVEGTYQRGLTPIYNNLSVRNYLRGAALGAGLKVRL